MLRIATAAAALGVSLAVACSSSNTPSGAGPNSSGPNNTAGASFSMTTLSDGAVVTTETLPDGATMVVPSSSVSGSNNTGGSTSSAGSTGSTVSTADSGDEGPVCTNTNFDTIPIPTTGFVDRACNVYGIQGAWYCFSDMATTTSGGSEGCIKGALPVDGTPGACLSGSLPASTSSYIGIGVSLNATGGANAVKSAYNATASGVVGFAITVTGTITGADLRIGFTNDDGTTANYVAPFVDKAAPAAGAQGTTYDVFFTNPVPSVPATFTGTADPGAMLDPTKIFDVQVEIPGQSTAVTYSNFCVTSITPLFSNDAGSPGSCSMMVDIGGQNCSDQDIVDGFDYGFQNNITSSSGECVQATQGGDCAGMTVSFTNGSFGSGGNVPSSFPSIIYGWQNGTFYGAYQTAKQLMSITSVPANWSYSVPGGTYDAAWDIWFGSTPTGTTPTLELMVWNGYNGVQPAGSNTNKTVTINGNSYQVWTGQVNSWKYIAYRAASPSATGTLTAFDLNKFFVDAEGEGVGLSTSSYLWGIQAGYEIYSASASYTTSTYSVTVN